MSSKRNWYAELLNLVDDAGRHLDFEALCLISRKVVWCYKFKHITPEQKDELCELITEYYERCKVAI